MATVLDTAADAKRLCVRDLRKDFPTRGDPIRVLAGVSLELAAGESLAVMGPSGAGKSTLLHVIATLEPPTSGQVTLGGVDPFALPEWELADFRNRQVGFVFQDHHLLPQCSVVENVLIPTVPGGVRDDDPERRARELLDQVGLSDRLEHFPAELSGGERQRVAIARALINQPALLLADEPTGNLDRATAEAVVTLLLEMHQQRDTILMMVTHSAEAAARFGKQRELRDGTLAPASRDVSRTEHR